MQLGQKLESSDDSGRESGYTRFLNPNHQFIRRKRSNQTYPYAICDIQYKRTNISGCISAWWWLCRSLGSTEAGCCVVRFPTSLPIASGLGNLTTCCVAAKCRCKIIYKAELQWMPGWPAPAPHQSTRADKPCLRCLKVKMWLLLLLNRCEALHLTRAPQQVSGQPNLFEDD